MEDLDLLIEKMIADGKSDDEIKNAIKDYKAGKLNGAAEKDATATPETNQASENTVSQSEDISLEQYDAMTPDQKKQIKNYKLKQKLIRESAAKRKNDKKEIKETEKTIKEEDLKYNEDYNRKLKGFEMGNIIAGEFLASIPETLYNYGAILPNMVAEPENYPLALQPLAYQLKQKGYLPDVVTAEKTKKKYNIKNPLLDYYREEREKIQKKNSFYDENANEYIGVFESFKNGKYSEGFSQLGNSILESAPVSIAMMAGGAGTSFGKLAVAGTIAMTDAELQEQRKNNPDQTETENMMKALGMAGSEMVFESVGKGTLGKAYKTIIAKEGKEKGIKIFRDGL